MDPAANATMEMVESLQDELMRKSKSCEEGVEARRFAKEETWDGRRGSEGKGKM